MVDGKRSWACPSEAIVHTPLIGEDPTPSVGGLESNSGGAQKTKKMLIKQTNNEQVRFVQRSLE